MFDLPHHLRSCFLSLACFASIGATLPAPVWAMGETTRVSVDSKGNQGNFWSSTPSISADGRYVAFQSRASNLVAGDGGNNLDVFVHDRRTGKTTWVSVNSTGTPEGFDSMLPSISADGRYVAFESRASNLVEGDTNGTWDIFVRDRHTSQTTRVSVDSQGTQGNSLSSYSSISADGRYVAFASAANNLVARDTNGAWDVFVHDRRTGQTTRVSVNSAGTQGNADSTLPSISADGRYVAFQSYAGNLVAGESNGYAHVFVHDRRTGETTRVSVDSAGGQGNDWSFPSSISADGRFVAFFSPASNLVEGDTNDNTDCFVHDLRTGQTTRVSVDGQGMQGNSGCSSSSISADGRYVTYSSNASNLVTGDDNANTDIFVHDRWTGQTTLVSVSSGEKQGNSWSDFGPISADGRSVAFSSFANNLVHGDTNSVQDIFVRDRFLARGKQADMQLTLAPNADQATVGNPLEYTATVTNNGPDEAGNVSMTVMLSTGVAVLSPDAIAADQGNCTAGPISVCYLGRLAANASTHVSLTLNEAPGKAVTAQASVNAGPEDADVDNNAVTVKTSVSR